MKKILNIFLNVLQILGIIVIIYASFHRPNSAWIIILIMFCGLAPVLKLFTFNRSLKFFDFFVTLCGVGIIILAFLEF